MITLYQRLVATGWPIEHHETDLYVRMVPCTTAAIEAYKADGGIVHPSVFTSDGTLWYDLPFQYDP
jgi:hypothetical protein